MTVGTFFDGTDDQITSASGNDWSVTAAWSIAAMVYVNASDTNRTIFSSSQSGTSRIRLYFDSGTVVVETGADQPPWFTAFTSPNWYFVVVTKASGTVAPKLYLTSDGSVWSKDGAAADAGTLANPAAATIDSIGIGHSLLASFWKGEIAAIVVTNTELSGATAKGLIDYSNWASLTGVQFNTGISLVSGGTMADSSGVGNNETSRTGATTGAQTIPPWFSNFPASGPPSAPANTAGTKPNPHVVESIGSAITTSRSPSVTFTQAVAPGDWVVLMASSTTTGHTMTEPSGWTNPLGAGVDVESDSHQMACAYHQVTAAESAANTLTYTATNWYGATHTGYTHGFLIRNANPSTLIDTATSTFDSGNTVTPHVFPAVTPQTQGGLVLASVAKDATGAYSSVPGGMTQLLASNTNQGRWSGYYTALTTKATAVGPTNITPSAGDEYASIVLSLTTNYDAFQIPTPNPFAPSPYLLLFLDDRYLGERNAGVAGPINYLIDLAGTLTSSALLAMADSKPLAGSTTPAGAASKLIGKPGLAGSVASSGSETETINKGLAGTVTSAGALTRAISKALAGTITPVGALAKLISKPGLAGTVTSSGSETGQENKGLAGSVTPTGSLAKAMSKGLAGSVTSAGVLTKLVAKAFSGTITPAGALSNLKASLLTFTGTITSSGALTNQTDKGLSASTAPSGAIGKSISKPGLAGSVASSGSETGTMNKGLAGTVSSSGSFVGSLAKALAGTVTSAASIAKFISKGLTGSETPTGSLDISSGNQISLSGSVTPVGSLANAVSKALAGSTSLAGTIAKLVSKGPSGTLTPTGDLTTSSGTNLSLSGTVSPVGALSRSLGKALSGSMSLSGALARLISKPLAGSTTPAGALAKQAQKGYSATVTSSGAIVQVLGKGLSGTISGVGALAKLIAKSFTGLLTSSGTVTLVNPNAVTVVPGPFDAHWEICLEGPPTLFLPDQSFEICFDLEHFIIE